MLKKILLLIAVIIICSCSNDKTSYEVKEINGIKTFINSRKPSVKELKITLDEKDVFNKDENDSTGYVKYVMSFDTDKDDNLYIVDIGSYNVKKFDKNYT